LLTTIRSQKELIRKLRKKEKWLQLIFDLAPINIYLKDSKGCFIAVNREFEKVFGVTDESLRGKSNASYLDQDIQGMANAHDRRVLETGKYSEQEENIGSRIFRVIKHPVFDQDGTPFQIMGFDVDVTELKKTQRELEHRNRELEAYASHVAHDLKAPLRRIRQFSDILFDEYQGGLDEYGTEYLCRIRDNASHLAELIEAMLTFSKLGRGGVEFHPVDLGELLSGIISRLTGDSGITIDNPEEMSAVEGHRPILEIVFQNLLDNALKFIPPKKDRQRSLSEPSWLERHGVSYPFGTTASASIRNIRRRYSAFSNACIQRTSMPAPA